MRDTATDLHTEAADERAHAAYCLGAGDERAHAAYCLGAADAYTRFAAYAARTGDTETAEEVAEQAAYARERAATYYTRFAAAAGTL